jgi:tetratricopeptide (TPR) repeat protein
MTTENLPAALRKLCSQLNEAVTGQRHERAIEIASKLLAAPELRAGNEFIRFTCHLNRGLARRRQRDLSGALEDAQMAASLNPRSFKPHLNAALLYAQDLADYKKAISEFDAALNLSPTCVEALSSRGLTKEIIDDRDGAESDFKTALSISPNDANTLCNYGTLKFNSGQWAEAVELYQQALAANPRDPEIRVNLGIALERMGAQRAAADVLRTDRRARELWESKGGAPVRPSGSILRVAVMLVVVIGILYLGWTVKN